MVEERASPSTGWREVYELMDVEGGSEIIDDDPNSRDESDGEPDQCPGCGLEVARQEEHRCPVGEVGRVE